MRKYSFCVLSALLHGALKYTVPPEVRVVRSLHVGGNDNSNPSSVFVYVFQSAGTEEVESGQAVNSQLGPVRPTLEPSGQIFASIVQKTGSGEGDTATPSPCVPM